MQQARQQEAEDDELFADPMGPPKVKSSGLAGLRAYVDQMQFGASHKPLGAERLLHDSPRMGGASPKQLGASSHQQAAARPREMPIGGGFDSNVMPRAGDPKLWCVKCFGGEQECLNMLMIKLFLKQKADPSFVPPIFSAFCSPRIKGYIYVESFKEAELRSFLQGVKMLSAWDTRLVPEEEMVSVLRMGVSSAKETESKVKAGRKRVGT